MIRQHVLQEQLFYGADELYRPAARNFYARLNEAVGDWAKLAAPFEPAFCADRGRPTDPGVYLKILLVGYVENITYDTDLAERVEDSTAIRRFVGYNLAEQTPDHSSISRKRAEIGCVCDIDEVLTRVVSVCTEAGLVEGDLTATDSALVAANASLSSLRSVRTHKSVREHLKAVREANAAPDPEHAEPAPAQANGAPARDEPQGPTESEACRLTPADESPPPTKKERAAKLEVSNAEFRSTTDPDARIAKKPGTPRGMYYKATHVTDSAHGIIVAAGCARADVADTEAALPILAQAKANLAAGGKELGKNVADAGYDDADFHAEVEDLGATPITNHTADTTTKPDGYKKADFDWVAEANCYICPAGALVRYVGEQEDRLRYVSDARECARCCGRALCIGGKGRVRSIYRHRHEQARERNIARCHSDEGREALRARKTIVEAPFGHAKTYGGLGRINCRGLPKAHVKVVLAAVAWNLIKLVGARDKAQQAEPAWARQAQQAQAALCALIGLLLTFWGLIWARLTGFGRALGAVIAHHPLCRPLRVPLG